MKLCRPNACVVGAATGSQTGPARRPLQASCGNQGAMPTAAACLKFARVSVLPCCSPVASKQWDVRLNSPRRSGSKEVVKAILAAGPRGRHPCIKDVNKHSLTPLGEALVAGRCDVADLLVSEASAYPAEGIYIPNIANGLSPAHVKRGEDLSLKGTAR